MIKISDFKDETDKLCKSAENLLNAFYKNIYVSSDFSSLAHINTINAATKALEAINQSYANMLKPMMEANKIYLNNMCHSLDSLSRICELSKTWSKAYMFDFKSINSTILLEKIDDIKEENDEDIPDEIYNFIKENPETINSVLKDLNNKNVIKTTNLETETDWKYLIGTIILPIILFLLGYIIPHPEEQKQEINNYYHIEIKEKSSSEDINETIKLLEELQHEEQQRNGIDNDSEQ